jgi:glycosyltransferase involved in cell wall biosynthesis
MFDILVTTFNRVNLLRRTVESLLARTTARTPYRIFIVDDASTDGTPEYLMSLRHPAIQSIIWNKVRSGVVCGFNELFRQVEYLDRYYAENPYLCYLQDDVEIMEDDWLHILQLAYEDLNKTYPIGFFCGFNAKEHITEVELPWHDRKVLLKTSTRATNLIASKQFWHSIGYIPKENPDGSSRGFPNDGRGSHIDVYLTGCSSGSRFQKAYSAPNSSYRQGKKVLVVPGLLHHLAEPDRASTWR